MDWKEKAIKLLDKSLKPVPQELNEIDWKGGLSDNKERLAQHICAFSNLLGGGILVYGVNNDASLGEMTQDKIELVVNRLDNIAQNRMFTPIQLDHAVMEYAGHALLFVYIPEFREKPMYLRGTDIYNSYIRSAGHTVRASRQQLRQMIADSEGVSYENRIAKQGVAGTEVLKLLNYKKLFELLGHQQPSTENGILSFMEELNICHNSSKGYNTNRLVITNPGYSLNDVNRLIDLPPHSRDEQMAQLMLQLGLCERRGSGVDRAVEALEKMLLPAYKAESGDDFTRITLYPKKLISAMTREERIAACYQHCCLVYANNETMNNQSFRERLGLNKNQGTIASHIISDTVSKGLIKPSNPDSESRKFVSYIPFYA